MLASAIPPPAAEAGATPPLGRAPRPLLLNHPFTPVPAALPIRSNLSAQEGCFRRLRLVSSYSHHQISGAIKVPQPKVTAETIAFLRRDGCANRQAGWRRRMSPGAPSASAANSSSSASTSASAPSSATCPAPAGLPPHLLHRPGAHAWDPFSRTTLPRFGPVTSQVYNLFFQALFVFVIIELSSRRSGVIAPRLCCRAPCVRPTDALWRSGFVADHRIDGVAGHLRPIDAGDLAPMPPAPHTSCPSKPNGCAW